MCAAYFGMTPAQVDELSFRDLNAMIAGAMNLERDRRRADLERALVIGGGFHNPKILQDVHRQLQQPQQATTMSLDEYRRRRDAALEKIAERYGNSSTS